jgi:hypothetical protein
MLLRGGSSCKIGALFGGFMTLLYQLKEGNYHLYDLSTPASRFTGEHRLRLKTDSVAIAFEASTGALREHGSPLRIHSWANNTRRRLRASGAQDHANDIVVVSGPLPVDEINKCLKIDGYCREMFARLATLPHGKLGGQGPRQTHHTTR